MRTILWIIKFSVIVHLCVENSFSWWNSLFLFFNLKHQIDWYIKHTKYFLRVPCRIYNGLLCYHIKTTKRKLLLSQLLPNLCQFSGSAIISENSEDYFPRVSLLGVFKASDVVNRCALLNLLTYCRCHSGFGPPADLDLPTKLSF